MKIFFDENTPGQLAEALNTLENNSLEKLDILATKYVFGSGVADEELIPKIGEVQGFLITQDLNIHRTRHQKELYIKHGLGVIFIKPPSKKGFRYWEFVKLVINRWEEVIKIFKKEQKPFAFRCSSRSRLEKIL